MKKSEDHVRRCRCHKAIINVERDENGFVVKRFCMARYGEIPKERTYLSTHGSTGEIIVGPEPDVQRGAKLHD